MPKTLRVVVVDDVDDARESLAAALVAGGIAVEGAADEDAAVAATRRFRPDVVVLDLPVADVIEMAGALRAVAPAAKLVAIIEPGERQRASARDAGVDFFLLRPCPAKDVLNALRRLW